MSKQRSPLKVSSTDDDLEFDDSFIYLGDPKETKLETGITPTNPSSSDELQSHAAQPELFVDLDSVTLEESTPEKRYWRNERKYVQTQRRRRGWRRGSPMSFKTNKWVLGIGVLLLGSSSLAVNDRLENKKIFMMAADLLNFGESKQISDKGTVEVQRSSEVIPQETSMLVEAIPLWDEQADDSVVEANVSELKEPPSKPVQLVTGAEKSDKTTMFSGEQMWDNPITGLSIAVDPGWQVINTSSGVQFSSLFRFSSDSIETSSTSVSIRLEPMNSSSFAEKLSHYISRKKGDVVFHQPLPSIDTSKQLVFTVKGKLKKPGTGQIHATLVQHNKNLWVVESLIDSNLEHSLDALERLRLSLLATIL